MNVQYFIIHAPAVTVSTNEGTVTSPGMQLQCGICPARVFIQHLTNLLPLMEHARTHEHGMRGVEKSSGIGGTVGVQGLLDAKSARAAGGEAGIAAGQTTRMRRDEEGDDR